MTLACLSDTHGIHEELDMSKYPADVLVYAGDWTRGADEALEETQSFLRWFSEQPYNHRILVAGNHERAVEANSQLFSDLLLQYPEITYLENAEVSIDGIKFYGSPYSNRFGAWAFMDDDAELAKIWAAIPDDTKVLITHGPAYGCLDKVINNYSSDQSVGSKSLTARKLQLNILELHISGHIHEASGIIEQDGCLNIGASILNERYALVNEPRIIEV